MRSSITLVFSKNWVLITSLIRLTKYLPWDSTTEWIENDRILPRHHWAPQWPRGPSNLLHGPSNSMQTIFQNKFQLSPMTDVCWSFKLISNFFSSLPLFSPLLFIMTLFLPKFSTSHSFLFVSAKCLSFFNNFYKFLKC